MANQCKFCDMRIAKVKKLEWLIADNDKDNKEMRKYCHSLREKEKKYRQILVVLLSWFEDEDFEQRQINAKIERIKKVLKD